MQLYLYTCTHAGTLSIQLVTNNVEKSFIAAHTPVRFLFFSTMLVYCFIVVWGFSRIIDQPLKNRGGQIDTHLIKLLREKYLINDGTSLRLDKLRHGRKLNDQNNINFAISQCERFNLHVSINPRLFDCLFDRGFFFQANNNEIIKAQHYWPSVRGIHQSHR